MKRLVNGVEADLAESDAEVGRMGDRLVVRTSEGTFTAAAVREGDTVHVSFRGRQFRVQRAAAGGARRAAGTESGEILAPMPGAIVDVLVEKGQTVAHRQKLLVLEAMKTQQAFVAPFDGIVAVLNASQGRQVQEGELLVQIEPKEAD